MKMEMKIILKTCATCKDYSPFEDENSMGYCTNEISSINGLIPPPLITNQNLTCPHYSKSVAQLVKELGY